ncbi:hypothetical protein V6N13_047783 [Hibiscus sabdariffa]|uniref:RING-type E3 ubiquitin transferase n=1 Tax=Hibiscus sabdariffa TaxID=183260 RepID=A0ABR2F571_9ROSI
MASVYNGFLHHVFASEITSETHPVPSSQPQVHQVLAPVFTSLGINSSYHHTMVDTIIRRGLEIADWTLEMGFNCRVLRLDSEIRATAVVSAACLEFVMSRFPAEEMESSDYGMVPAQESSVREMVATVRVDDGDDNCTICLEGFEAGSYAARMPCSHIFHGECIEEWLKQSHYCPVCRSGSLSLKWNGSVEYWNVGFKFNSSINGNLSSPRFMLRSNGILVGLDASVPGGMVNMAFSTDYGEGNGVFRFLRMDDDGNLRIYSTSGNGGAGNMAPTWAAVTDQCRVFGFCGDMRVTRVRLSRAPHS